MERRAVDLTKRRFLSNFKAFHIEYGREQSRSCMPITQIDVQEQEDQLEIDLSQNRP